MKKVTNLYKEVGIDYRTFRLFQQDPSKGITAPPVADNYYSRALYVQYLHETGNQTSRLWKEFNNMYGMRPSQKRQKFYVDTVDTQTGRYAIYDDMRDSIADRENLDQYNNINYPMDYQGVVRYYNDIQSKGYATDPGYITKLMALYNQTFGDLELGEAEDYNETASLGDYPQTEDNVTKSFVFSIWYIIIPLAIYGIYRISKLIKK